MDNLHLSQEGLDKLKIELEQSRKRTMEIAKEIDHARSLGDLRENAEYHAAKEAQAKNHARIRDLEDKVARSVVVDDSLLDTSRAYLGANVQVRNLKTGKEFTYKLVSAVEADMAHGKISIKSPVGQAIAGSREGDKVVAKVPAGDIGLEILSISR